MHQSQRNEDVAAWVLCRKKSRMGRIKYIWVIMLLFVGSVHAQNDSARVLHFEEYMDLVKAHHPVARQADLQLEKGDAALLKARGGFDPKAFTDLSQKKFDGKEYYRLLDGGLKVPTWFGIEVKSGFEQNKGTYLNPEHKTPESGLWYGGISVPIGQGLFIDERRSELRQAQIYKESTQAERQMILNDLLYESGKVYWDWFVAYNVLKVYEDAVAVADQRLRAVKQSVLLGDRPAIDTLEAGIQFQSRRIDLQQAQLAFTNTSALLSVYLWADGLVPLEIAEGTVPVTMDQVASVAVDPAFFAQLNGLQGNHPELQQYQFKIDQLLVERRWKQEQLKPRLNLQYNALSKPVNGNPWSEYSSKNYKWGLEFSMPVFLRKERGSLRQANLKLQEAQLGFTAKNASLTYKATASLNEWKTTQEQVDLYRQTVRDYLGLLTGERRMFDMGESSLFMVNSREAGYINTQVKLIELMAKNHKASLTTNYAFGVLNNQ